MLDIGWTELLIIGVVALIVVGPKDLPKMFRTLGQLTGKARAMAREFQRAMDAAADETGVKGMAKDLRDVASGRKFKDEMGLDELDREMRDMGRPDQWGNEGAARKTETVAERAARVRAERAAARAEAEADEAMATQHDGKSGGEGGGEGDLAARNAKASAVETERLKAADRAAAARNKAAEIRARREAESESKSDPESGTQSGTAKPRTGRSGASTKSASTAGTPDRATRPDPAPAQAPARRQGRKAQDKSAGSKATPEAET